MESWKKRTVLLVVGLLVAVLAVAGGAIAQVTFPDVAEDDAHAANIEWAAENGIVNGFADGTFRPYQNLARAQAATMFANYEEFRMEGVEARRGCTDCHDPAGPFSLKNEAVNAVNIVPHSGLPDNAGANVCLGCHAMDADGTGNLASISLRDIVHPVHMYSKIFAWEFMGNCFSCHNVDANGEFDILPEGIATDEGGIPDAIPIDTQQDPISPGT